MIRFTIFPLTNCLRLLAFTSFLRSRRRAGTGPHRRLGKKDQPPFMSSTPRVADSTRRRRAPPLSSMSALRRKQPFDGRFLIFHGQDSLLPTGALPGSASVCDRRGCPCLRLFAPRPL